MMCRMPIVTEMSMNRPFLFAFVDNAEGGDKDPGVLFYGRFASPN